MLNTDFGRLHCNKVLLIMARSSNVLFILRLIISSSNIPDSGRVWFSSSSSERARRRTSSFLVKLNYFKWDRACSRLRLCPEMTASWTLDWKFRKHEDMHVDPRSTCERTETLEGPKVREPLGRVQYCSYEKGQDGPEDLQYMS